MVVVADIPGLLEGAHVNVGLGHAFLRHVERCKTFVYVIDVSLPDALQQFCVVQREMELYQTGLTNRPSVLVANKCDLVDNLEELMIHVQRNVTLPVVVLSAKYKHNIDELRALLFSLFAKKSHANDAT